MSLYYWASAGRLGNLIFQWAALRTYLKPEDYCLCFEPDFFAHFAGEQEQHQLIFPLTGRPQLKSTFKKILGRTLRSAAKLRLISSITLRQVPVVRGFSDDSSQIMHRRGLVRSIIYFHGYFQFTGFIENSLKLKASILAPAIRFLAATLQGRTPVAVHLRFGDYLTHSVCGQPGAELSPQWYTKALAEMSRRVDNPLFILISDDPDRARTITFSNKYPVIVYQGQYPIDDFALITRCAHVIVPASSFSLAGALLNWTAGKIIIIPKYFLGFKLNTWFPPSVALGQEKYLLLENA
jgi:hypothetical protein